jgi:hypothetical protein
MERYKKEWYDKRAKQNKIIKAHLIDIINKHKESQFPWTSEDLACLNYEDLFEIAVAAVNKEHDIILGKGQDWSCGRDGKVSIARYNSINNATYSAGITGCKNKKHILALVYEGLQEIFYYFSFPVRLNEHTVPFDPDTGEPIRYTTRGPQQMWQYHECPTFEDMALIIHQKSLD